MKVLGVDHGKIRIDEIANTDEGKETRYRIKRVFKTKKVSAHEIRVGECQDKDDESFNRNVDT